MSDDAGYVTFEVGPVAMAVAVCEVREVLRAGALQSLPASDRRVRGGVLRLIDAHGRSVPALDLRPDHGGVPDVLLARSAERVALIVDRVSAVLGPGELVPEVVAPDALPSYATGVLRPASGGPPVLLLELPHVTDQLAALGADSGSKPAS